MIETGFTDGKRYDPHINETEYDCKSYIHFLESLEVINQSIKHEIDLEQMLRSILEKVFIIFNCDRTWLFYPCDPYAGTFRVPMEIYRPEYPGAMVLNTDIPMTPGMAANLQEALDSEEPVVYIWGTEKNINNGAAKFGVQSQMFTSIYPRLGKPWVFGMHQCSYPRIWTKEEKKLFKEIALRISDGLSSVLFLRELQENEERFRATFEQAAVGIAHVAPDGRWLRVNQKLCSIVGYSRDELLKKTFQDITCPEYLDSDLEHLNRLLSGEISTYNKEKKYIRKDGSTVWIELTVSIVRKDTIDASYFISVIEDIDKRKKAEDELFKSRQMLQLVMDNIPQRIFWKDLDSVYLGCNKPLALDAAYGEPWELIGKTDYEMASLSTADLYRADDRQVMEANIPKLNYEEPQVKPDGSPAWLKTSKVPLHDTNGNVIGVLGMYEDITMRKKEEDEKHKLQAQLLQAQKMESIGRLAGGVAHDFNNMLVAILGYAELALYDLSLDSALRDNLEQIRMAGQRAANLTRQLLAFARKQTVSPIILNLNETVDSMLSMLGRLIGEDIKLNWLPANELWNIKMDPSQVDQILANLCVNARDACAGPGKITIETHNIAVDEDYCSVHEGFFPGEYVMLSVSDNGCGMDKEIMDKLFEPFFTTKGLGQGTGLGLSTVYGIVKQNNGFINVYSEPEKGTTFRIYIPRYEGKSEKLPAEYQGDNVSGGCETILLVEDEFAILKLARIILEKLGYQVLAAGKPLEALEIAEKYSDKIELLVTDIIMPDMTGMELYNRLLSLYPDIKGLFMSGYTANVISRHGILKEGMCFIQKPFSVKELGSRIRQLLDKNE